MSSQQGESAPSKEMKGSPLKSFLAKLRKRHIIETLAAFIGGGWLVYEIVERVLVLHYKFPETLLDITLVTLIAAMLCTILWRWFGSAEKRPGNVKVEVLLVPLVMLVALAIDLNLVLQMAGISGKKLLIGIIALCLGIVWVFVKLYQWAASTPDAAAKKLDISKLAEIKPEKSIVVLPFADLSPQKDQEYFCDGMTEEIISDLSHVRDLLVISRSSAMTFRGTKKTIPEIARAVNVRYVLEGSVRKAGNSLRIAAQLIDPSTDAHLWAEKYSGPLDDVFDIQEKVSSSIVDALKVKLQPEEKQRMMDRPIENVAAYDLHIRAYHEIWRGTEQGLETATRLIEKGFDVVGDNEILYADMGLINIMYIDAGIKKDEGLLVNAEECIRKIFAINPKSSYGHYLKGMIDRKKRDTQQAVREFKESLAIDPNHPDSLLWLSWVYAYSGKAFAARPLNARLLKIDPLNPLNYFFSGALWLMEGEFGRALKEFERAQQMDEHNPLFRYWSAKSLSYAQSLGEALTLFDFIEKESPGTIWANLGTFFKYALENKKPEAVQVATADFKRMVRDDELFPIWMAESFALLDEKAEAIDWIENGVNSGFVNYPFLMKSDPFLANLRGEPRFKKLMERVKYEWEHFEV